MLCDKCGKNHATTHIRSVVNGVVTEHNLCGYCAAAAGYSGAAHSSLGDMLASMFGDALNSGSVVGKKHCECCGASFSDIAEKGRVGCSECYKTFYEQLLPYMRRVHSSTKHVGKIPNRAPLIVKKEDDSIESLKMQLNELVRQEKFEEAAVIRDKIKDIKGGES